MGVKRGIALLKQGVKDIAAYFMFKKQMKAEADDPASIWHDEGLKHNKFWSVIYKIVDIPQEYEMGATQQMKYNYLIDACRQVNEWFDIILVWGEYLIFKLFHFENAEDPSEKTLTYQAEWHFVPIALTQWKFWVVLLLFILFNGALAWAAIKFLALFIIALF